MTTFLTKVAQISRDFWGYFGKHHYFSKNCSSHFWVTLGKLWLLFSLSSGHTDGTTIKKMSYVRASSVEQNVDSRFLIQPNFILKTASDKALLQVQGKSQLVGPLNSPNTCRCLLLFKYLNSEYKSLSRRRWWHAHQSAARPLPAHCCSHRWQTKKIFSFILILSFVFIYEFKIMFLSTLFNLFIYDLNAITEPLPYMIIGHARTHWNASGSI